MPPSPQGEGLRRALREAPLRREATGRRGRRPLQRDERPHPPQCEHWGTFPVRGEGFCRTYTVSMRITLVLPLSPLVLPPVMTTVSPG